LKNAVKPTAVVGINSVRQMEIFRILSGIMHLGNVELVEDKADSSSVPVSYFLFQSG